MILGSRNPFTEGLIGTVYGRYVLNKLVLVLDESRAGTEVDLPLASGKVSMNGLPTAYVCQQFRCSPPVTDSAHLESLL